MQEWKAAQDQCRYERRGPNEYVQLTGSLLREMHLSRIFKSESELGRLRKLENWPKKEQYEKTKTETGME